jgi:hypothetical protein
VRAQTRIGRSAARFTSSFLRRTPVRERSRNQLRARCRGREAPLRERESSASGLAPFVRAGSGHVRPVPCVYVDNTLQHASTSPFRGYPPHVIQSRAGHTDYATTLGYIREAEALAKGSRKFIPPLPILATDWASHWTNSQKLVPKYAKSCRGGRDSNPAGTYDSRPTQVDSRQLDLTRVDASARELVAFGPKNSTVEDALARAIEGAVSAGRWDVVAQLTKELETRRLAAAGVMRLADERAKRASPGQG